VPTLVFEDGEVLIESTAILDYLDEVVGPSKAMIAENGRSAPCLEICALATGLGDKAVSLIYERVLRKDELKLWVERCEARSRRARCAGVRARRDFPRRTGFGTASTCDIAVAWRCGFTAEAHPTTARAAR